MREFCLQKDSGAIKMALEKNVPLIARGGEMREVVIDLANFDSLIDTKSYFSRRWQ